MSTTKTSAQVPKLRFPRFESQWNEASLSEAITSLDAGVSVNSEDTPVSGDERGILKTSCVTKGYFDPSENKRVLDPAEISRLKEPVSKDSIVISRMNTPALVGLSGLVTQDEKHLFLPDRLWAAKVAPSHSPRWIAQLLASEKIRGQLSDRASGTSGSMKNITKGDVLSLPVIIPTLPEQRKIAAFLTAVDGRIGQLSQKKALLEDYKKGVMQQLFTQALRFKDDYGNEFPEWEEKTLGDVAQLISGQHLDPEQYDDSGEGVPYFTGPSDFTSDPSKFTKWTKFSSKVAPPDSVLITVKGNGVGKLMYSTLPQVAMGRQLMAIRSESFSNVLLYQFLLTKTQQFVALGSGNLIPGLSRPDILSFVIPAPSVPEQTKIANFLSALDRKIESVAQQTTHTQAFKQGLLQQMFV